MRKSWAKQLGCACPLVIYLIAIAVPRVANSLQHIPKTGSWSLSIALWIGQWLFAAQTLPSD
jgi:hypothetical protein